MIRGIPAKTIDFITDIYTGPESSVKCYVGVFGFSVIPRVMQRRILPPTLFHTSMDKVLGIISS